ncbi:NHL repeat-containing protein [Botryobacter ruber]|uniref:hypothetical protein n=1 Tax=Botryobacter ruber TaxID=2171629 RepID=UPI000E0CA315|nr:hypothetical protein [Botryobacter ruber]
MKLMFKVLIVFLSVMAIALFVLRKPYEVKPAAPAALKKIATLPYQVRESSGIEVLPNNEYITHNDAGNKPYLYKLNQKGKLTGTIKLQLPNVDWEDLARDDKGNIYIGDTGNNNNKRRELAIYKVNINHPSKLEAIRFTFEDQTQFPPDKKDMNFDCEAIFWHGGNIYLVSKDRGRKRTAKVYRLKDNPGTQQAKLIGSHEVNAEISGAAISPNADKVALVSEAKLHLFRHVKNPEKYYEADYKEINLPGAGQTEAVAFITDTELVLTSEGGNLYRYSIE